ncbi:MAG: hypothetical protein AAFQ73_15830 [Pseudomonadota bacterium]
MSSDPPDRDLRVDPAEPAPSASGLAGRLLALERLTEDRWLQTNGMLARIERAIDRIENRLWIAVSACAAAGAGAIGSLIWRATAV